MRIQPRSAGKTRRDLHPRVEKEIFKAVDRDAARWNCSRSWIIATALAAFYGIDIIKPYSNKRKAA